MCQLLKKKRKQGMIVHSFNTISWNAEAGGSSSSRPAQTTANSKISQGYTEKNLSQKKKKWNKYQDYKILKLIVNEAQNDLNYSTTVSTRFLIIQHPNKNHFHMFLSLCTLKIFLISLPKKGYLQGIWTNSWESW